MTGPARRVFGASSGAITALHLLTAHPGRVARLVAHEPPVVELLPDAPEHRALVARVRDAYRDQGLMPAMAAFAEGMKKDDDGSGPPPRANSPARGGAGRADQGQPAPVRRTRRPRFHGVRPDADRLKAPSDRLVRTAGRDSRGELPHRAVAALAEHLGTGLRHFPGGHIGLTTHPAEFAERLRDALGTR